MQNRIMSIRFPGFSRTLQTTLLSHPNVLGPTIRGWSQVSEAGVGLVYETANLLGPFNSSWLDKIPIARYWYLVTVIVTMLHIKQDLDLHFDFQIKSNKQPGIGFIQKFRKAKYALNSKHNKLVCAPRLLSASDIFRHEGISHSSHHSSVCGKYQRWRHASHSYVCHIWAS